MLNTIYSIDFSIINMHHNTEYWGPDAHEFDPDRWLDERNKKYYMANPFIFLPLQGGRRICLGQQVRHLFARFLSQLPHNPHSTYSI